MTAVLLFISLLAIPSTAQDKESVDPRSSRMPEKEQRNSKQTIEYKIAGLRPGRDTIETAYGRFRKDRVIKDLSTPGGAVWIDPCNRQMLTVAFDPEGTIHEVSIEPYPIDADCIISSYSRTVRARLGGTGHGLVFRDSCNRIQEIYGEPQSQGRSVHGDWEFVYSFDRAVKGNSLTFELTCDAARDRVTGIKLTASRPAKPCESTGR